MNLRQRAEARTNNYCLNNRRLDHGAALRVLGGQVECDLQPVDAGFQLARLCSGRVHLQRGIEVPRSSRVITAMLVDISKREQEGIKIYKDQKSYHKWEFVYDITKDPARTGGAVPQAAPPPGTPIGGGTPGSPPGGQPPGTQLGAQPGAFPGTPGANGMPSPNGSPVPTPPQTPVTPQ